MKNKYIDKLGQAVHKEPLNILRLTGLIAGIVCNLITIYIFTIGKITTGETLIINSILLLNYSVLSRK